MPLVFLRAWVASVIVFAFTGGAWAVLSVDSFKAIHLIEGPYEELPYQTGGISNEGDIFGVSWWPDDANHKEHFEQAVRWMRSANYAPELVNGGQEHVVHPCCGGESGATAIAGEGYYGIHVGRIGETKTEGHRGVTPEGMAIGKIHVDVPSGGANFVPYHYDIKNDILTVLPPGIATDVNSQGVITEVWTDNSGSHSNGYYSRVARLDAADGDPPFEVVAWRPTFGNTDPFPFAINNQDIIVGSLKSIFGFGAEQPMKLLPTGENAWGDPIILDGLEGNSTVLDISDNVDRPFGVGVSGDAQKHAVVWDINSGTILADFGELTEAWQISSDGTKVAGIRKRFFPPGATPTVWSTDNQWADFTELDLNEALGEEAELAGSDIWVSLDGMNGINDSGQVVGQGIYLDDQEVEREGVFLLDTLSLDAILKGDVNNDAGVNNLDITPFIAALSAEDEAAFLTEFPNGNYAAADIDMSGSPDNLDITPFIGLLTASASNAIAVPEPSSLACVVLALMMGRRRLRTR